MKLCRLPADGLRFSGPSFLMSNSNSYSTAVPPVVAVSVSSFNVFNTTAWISLFPAKVVDTIEQKTRNQNAISNFLSLLFFFFIGLKTYQPMTLANLKNCAPFIQLLSTKCHTHLQTHEF